MSLPYFFAEALGDSGRLTLDEETSRHVVQVLRMRASDELLLTDGRGRRAHVAIEEAHKKHTVVELKSVDYSDRLQPSLTIAISLVKNTSRFEWFLEKATELGTSNIIPLLCARTEKQQMRLDRMNSICRSAMLQSAQAWMPAVSTPQAYADVVHKASQQKKFIAHCVEGEKRGLAQSNIDADDYIILIGPEGDFTGDEIALAIEHGFEPVTLGSTRLRTETAGLYAAAILRAH